MEGYDASTYGERFADVYDDWYGDVTDVDACTVALAELTASLGGGPVLELGVGSGRLAIPLAARGVEVHGVDASSAMLDRLRTKPGGDAVHASLGDMADLADLAPASFTVVFVAFNTFFNLATEDDQRRCLQRVGELLTPGGAFVLEAFVPAEAEGSGIDGSVTPRQLSVDEVVLTVSQRDREAQTISGQHVHITEGGIRLRPWHLRYLAPLQLDALAEACGLTLEQRRSGWSGEPFTESSTVHISTYRRTSFGDR